MVGFGTLMTTNTLLTLLFTFISMFSVNTKLALITLALTPISSYTFWTIGRRVNRRFEQLQAQFGDLSAKAQENFSGIRVVKAFSQEEPEITSFAKVNRDYLDKAVGLAKVNGLVWPAMQFILGGAVLAILYIGGQDAIEGRLTIGQLVQFIAYLQLISWPMIALGEVTNMIQQGWASLGRLEQIYEADPTVADPVDPVLAPIKGAVEFRSVAFAYGPAIVLRDISFAVPAGGSLAIVGPTGAGKSSLVNLIPRLFDAQQGEILIDGIDVKRYPLPALRRAVGYVPQETFLFSVPLRENAGVGGGGVAAGQGRRRLPGALRHDDRRAGRDPLWRPEAAHRHRSGGGEGPPHPHPRRRALGGGYLHRGRDPQAPARRDARADQHRRGAPHLHREGRRRDPRAR